VPFSRISDSDWALVDPNADNRFEAKEGDLYGVKAHEILSQVKGKGFRQQKQKKKNAYRGGPIGTAVNSIKFED
jgi:hypothetical protein